MVPARQNDLFVFPVGVMVEAGQYRMLYEAQVLRDSLLNACQYRVAVLEGVHRTDADHLSLLERRAASQEADLRKLRSQVSGLKSKGKLLATLGVIVGATTTYILVRKK